MIVALVSTERAEQLCLCMCVATRSVNTSTSIVRGFHNVHRFPPKWFDGLPESLVFDFCKQVFN